jgi:hypothetical protein
VGPFFFGAVERLYQFGPVIFAATLHFRNGFQKGEAVGVGKSP